MQFLLFINNLHVSVNHILINPFKYKLSVNIYNILLSDSLIVLNLTNLQREFLQTP